MPRSRILAWLCVVPVHCLPCTWNATITPEQAAKLNCGFSCPDPWAFPNPYYCGYPDPCCCDPSCDTGKSHDIVGINWSDTYSGFPLPRSHQFQILKNSGFRHIKTFTTSALPDIFKVYGNNVSVYVGITNNRLTEHALSYDYTKALIESELLPFKEIVKMVIVGNEPFLCIKTSLWLINNECGSERAPLKLLPAMKNIRRALVELGMPRPVSSPFNGAIIQSPNPWLPCSASYSPVLLPLLEPVWKFLREQDAPFIVNIYSWFAAVQDGVSPKLCVGYPTNSLPKDGAHNYYFNYDLQLDMHRVAMCKSNITDLDLWIGETGWPTEGAVPASLTNSRVFHENILRRARGENINDPKLDTIRFKGLSHTVFLFEAFDEERKFEIEHGNVFENNFGLFYEDGTPKWKDETGALSLSMEGKLPPQDLGPVTSLLVLP